MESGAKSISRDSQNEIAQHSFNEGSSKNIEGLNERQMIQSSLVASSNNLDKENTTSDALVSESPTVELENTSSNKKTEFSDSEATKEKMNLTNFLCDWTIAKDRVQDGRLLAESLQSILQERGEIERSYATKLHKLSDRIKSKDSESSRINSVMHALHLEAKRSADQHSELSDSIINEVVAQTLTNTVFNHRSVFDKLNRDASDDYKVYCSVVEAHQAAMKNYETRCREAYELSKQCQQHEYASPVQKTRAHLKAFKAERLAEDAEKRYILQTDRLNRTQDEYVQMLWTILKCLDDMDKKRIACMKDALRKTMIYQTSLLRNLQYDHNWTIKCIEDLDEALEVDEFCRRYGKLPVPKPHPVLHWQIISRDRSNTKPLKQSRKSFGLPSFTGHISGFGHVDSNQRSRSSSVVSEASTPPAFDDLDKQAATTTNVIESSEPSIPPSTESTLHSTTPSTESSITTSTVPLSVPSSTQPIVSSSAPHSEQSLEQSISETTSPEMVPVSVPDDKVVSESFTKRFLKSASLNTLMKTATTNLKPAVKSMMVGTSWINALTKRTDDQSPSGNGGSEENLSDHIPTTPVDSCVEAVLENYNELLDSIWNEDWDSIVKYIDTIESDFANSLDRFAMCRNLLLRQKMNSNLMLPSLDALRTLGLICFSMLSWSERQSDVWTPRTIMFVSQHIYAEDTFTKQPKSLIWDKKEDVKNFLEKRDSELHENMPQLHSRGISRIYLYKCIYTHTLWNKVQFWETALLMTICEDFQRKSLERSWRLLSVEQHNKEYEDFKLNHPCISLLMSFGVCMLRFGIIEHEVKLLIQNVCNVNGLDKDYRDRLTNCLEARIVRPNSHQRVNMPTTVPEVNETGVNVNGTEINETEINQTEMNEKGMNETEINETGESQDTDGQPEIRSSEQSAYKRSTSYESIDDEVSKFESPE